MNLLTDQWIPVRPLPAGNPVKITLRQLLCEDDSWELSLPRNDMEMAALQLLICMAQVFFTPKDIQELKRRIISPLDPDTFDKGCAPYGEWFQLDHPDYPFMQVKDVYAKDITPMDKLMAGLSGATSSCFVNEPGLGSHLCGGCAAIALFNQASCAPSFGGGFKSNLRDGRWPGKDGKGGLSGSPVTTLVQGENLRQTVWFNILSEEKVMADLPWHRETQKQKPTWVDPIKTIAVIPAQTIGLLRGLFWQPAHIELLPPNEPSPCSCCGFSGQKVFRGFKRAKFRYTIQGLWPHPHGVRTTIFKNNVLEERFISFTTLAPAWTQLSRFVVQIQTDDKTGGQQPAAVIRQAQGLVRGLRLNIGGYRNPSKLADIRERRHELIFLNDGWSNHTNIIHDLVELANGYGNALFNALGVFIKGLKKTKKFTGAKGIKINLQEIAKGKFFRRSEDAVLHTLSCIDFENPSSELLAMGEKLHQITANLFNESVHPYLNDPELVRTMAIARKILNKNLKALKPQHDGRNDNGSNT